MMVLAIDEKVRARATEIRAFAEVREHWRDLRDDWAPPGEASNLSMDIPIGFHVAFSVDYDGKQAFRHLSVSREFKDGKPQIPNRAAMRAVADLFGFSATAAMGTSDGDPPWVIHALEHFEP